MNDETWQMVKEVCDVALRLQASDRQEYIESACAGRPDVLREVESLLANPDDQDSFLIKPAVGEVADFIAQKQRVFSDGQKVGRYTILSKIGEGGMGEVYLAQDSELNREAAIKALSPDLSRELDKLNRFRQEAQAASALNHPNILTVYEIGKSEGTHFIAAEYVVGETLRECLSARDPIPVKQILKTCIQVAEALSAAHGAGIVHRDIKPENIMIRGDGYAKVLDFGLAKLTERNVSGAISPEVPTKPIVKTDPGMIMGTISYLSPEQARSEETDGRTDIWSLGVVLYEMCAGRAPFEGPTPNHTIVAILENEPPLLEGIPDELRRIISKALTKDKRMRYQTVRDLLIDLKNLKRALDVQGEVERSKDANRKGTAGANGKDNRNTATQRIANTSSLEYAVTQIGRHKLASAVVGMIAVGLIYAAVHFALLANWSANRIESVAVMPFVIESDDKDVEYLADGMTETLINSLSRVPNLKVKAKSSVFRYKGKNTKPQTLGKELNVRAILIGRVIQSGEQLALNLELINTATENVLWGNKYERRSSELISLQTEIARDVSGKLRNDLSDTDEAKVARTYTTDPDAYKLYLKGRFFWNKRNGEALKKSVGFYNQALEADPAYALAYSGLAASYVLFADYNAGTPKESFPKARAAAQRALEFDDSLAEPHSVLGNYLSYFEWDRKAAERELRKAIERNPNSATARQWLGYHLAITKRFDEALEELRLAEQLDPLSSIVSTSIGDTLLYARRYDEAIARYKRILSLDPNFLYARMNMGWAFHSKGMHREAIEEYQKALDVYYEPLIKAYLAVALGRSGQRREATRLLNQLKAESEHIYVPKYAIAIVYLALDKKEDCYSWLEKDMAERSTYSSYYAVVPDLDDLRSEPRFKDMLKRLDLPE